MFTALIAAIEFGILSKFLLNSSSQMDVSPLFKDISIIAIKNIVLILGGIIAAFLTIQIKQFNAERLTLQKISDRFNTFFLIKREPLPKIK